MYLNNDKLRGSGEVVDLSEHEIEEFYKCCKDPFYFMENYYLITTTDADVVKLKLFPYQRRVIGDCLENRFVIMNWPRQSLSLETDVPTLHGIKKLKDIHSGDVLFDIDGNETVVLYESEIFKDKPCYKVTFDTKDEVVASDDHLWVVSNSDWYHKDKIKTTKELFDIIGQKKRNGSGLYIKKCSGVDYIEKELLIDPYIFGYWLGDGNSKGGRITVHIDDKDNIKGSLIEKNYTVTEYTNINTPNVINLNIRELGKQLRSLRVYGNKHIPIDYLMASREQRISLIQGLMDTDGSCTRRSSCEFYQKNKNIIDQFRQLLASVGIKNRCRSKNIKGQLYYTVSFRTRDFNVFKLKRKLNRQYNGVYRIDNDRIYIKSIEICDSVYTKCLKVDSDTETFCITNYFIPTHNSGKTTCIISFILWNILFKPNVKILVCSKTEDDAKMIIDRLKFALENIPIWLQQGVTKYDSSDVRFENNSSVKSITTTDRSGRGGAYNIVFADEFAFIPSNIAEEFFAGVYPTISAGKKSKFLIASTPKNMNLFYRLWSKALQGDNLFKAVSVHWTEKPGRDNEWERQERLNIGNDQFEREYGCHFAGSEGALISPHILKDIKEEDPIYTLENFDIYEYPRSGGRYLVTVDTSEGIGLDYSVASVIDVTDKPYRLIAKYRNNKLHILDFPKILLYMAQKYNNAYILIEVGGATLGVGNQVAEKLYYELEYENLIYTTKAQPDNRMNQALCWNLSDYSKLGVKMTESIKNIGCVNLKNLVERGDFLFCDYDTKQELSVFVKTGKSFKADKGEHDDIVMTLVLFGWVSSQKDFEYLTQTSIGNIDHVLREQLPEIPCIIFNDGKEDFENIGIEMFGGDVWQLSSQIPLPYSHNCSEDVNLNSIRNTQCGIDGSKELVYPMASNNTEEKERRRDSARLHHFLLRK